MKLAKILSALALTVIMTVTLTCCKKEEPLGTPKEENKISDVEVEAYNEETLLSAMFENLNGAKSYTMEMTMDMKMEMEMDGLSMETETVSAIETLVNPVKTKTTTSVVMTIGKETQEVTNIVYAEQADDKMITYTETDGTWYKMSVPMAETSEFSPDAGFFDEAYTYEFVGEEAFVDTPCYKYHCTLNADELWALLTSSGAMDSIGGTGVDEQTMRSIIDGLASTGYDMWVVYETALPAAFEMDMSEMFKGLYATMGIDAPTQAYMKLVYTGFDNVESIEIPPEVTSAMEVDTAEQIVG